MILITPPIASAPYRVDCGPRITSMRSIRSGDRSDRSAWPVVVPLTRTPSTSTWIWLAFAPRIVRLEVLPRLPERPISTPRLCRGGVVVEPEVVPAPPAPARAELGGGRLGLRRGHDHWLEPLRLLGGDASRPRPQHEQQHPHDPHHRP